MAKPSYSDLLKDPRWQKKRLEILERDNWTCRSCVETTKTLHVHHTRYEWGKAPWESDDDDLVTYCESCHEQVTIGAKGFKAEAALLRDFEHLQIVGYMQGCRLYRDRDLKIKILSYEHADGIGKAFLVSGDEVLEAARERDYVVDHELMWALRKTVWPRRCNEPHS